jgi:epoxyqueuosine reductase
VCPWNAKFSRDATEESFTPRPELVAPDLGEFATMDEAEFRARFGDTPLSRAKRAGLQRNAAAVLSNSGDADKTDRG